MERKIAILGDIHANIDALDAVIDDARSRSCTDFVCVGDVVGYNSKPAECIARVRELNCVTVRGNHDHYCSYNENLDDFQPLAASVIEWTRRQLSEEDGRWLRDLPYKKAVQGLMLVHSTLDMPESWGYVFDELSAEANFHCQMTPICFHGHTHVPIIFERQPTHVTRIDPQSMKLALGSKYFVNVGSVGQPRDGDPRSAYVIYEPKTRMLEYVRVAYDVQAAMERNLKAGLPERLAHRLAQGR